jgi:hypothetical protein
MYSNVGSLSEIVSRETISLDQERFSIYTTTIK